MSIGLVVLIVFSNIVFMYLGYQAGKEAHKVEDYEKQIEKEEVDR